MPLKIRLLIDSVERQANLRAAEWQIEQNAHGKLDHATFTIDDPTKSISLARGKNVIIENFSDAADRKFGGVLTEVSSSSRGGIGRTFTCKALDWTFLLDRALVNFTYRGKSDQFIISDATDGIFTRSETSLTDFTRTTATVKEGNANTQFLQFKRVSIRDIMDTLKDMSKGFVWYVDPKKTVFYETFGTTSHTFHLSDAPDDVTSFAYFDLVRTIDITRVINRVTVEGGFLRELFAAIAAKATVYKGDAATVKHHLGFLWQASTGNTIIKVFQNNGADADPPWGTEAEKTVGTGGVDTLATKDTLWDPVGRTLEWAVAPPNKTNSFRIVGDRLRGMIAVAPDWKSINDLGRIYGYSIKDVTILSDEHAKLRAFSELRKRGAEAERLSCRTQKDGITIGKTLGVVSATLGIGSTGNPVDYLVDKVTTRLKGGQVAEYQLQLVAAP